VDVLYSGMWMYYIQVYGCIIFRYVDVLYSAIWMYYICCYVKLLFKKWLGTSTIV